MQGMHFFLVFESLKSQKKREKHENIENVENLLGPACSSSQSQPAHLARDAPSRPAWVEKGRFSGFKLSKTKKKCISHLHTFPGLPGTPRPSQILPNPPRPSQTLASSPNPQENVENLLDRDAPSLGGGEVSNLSGRVGGLFGGLGGSGRVWEGVGGPTGRGKGFQGLEGICIALLCYCSSHIYIYGTPPCTHAFPDVCQEMRGSWGGKV